MSIELKSSKTSHSSAVPFRIGFTYTHPPVDQVSREHQISATVADYPDMATITTIDDAIVFYLEVFANTYSSKLMVRRRTNFLRRFQKQVKDGWGINLLEELTYDMAQQCVDQMVSARNGKPISDDTRKDYKSAVRGFGRFLYQSGLIVDDIFFELHA